MAAWRLAWLCSLAWAVAGDSRYTNGRHIIENENTMLFGQYNPLSLVNYDRIHDISEVMSHVDILVLTGTQQRAPDRQRPHDTYETAHHHVISWGHRPTKYSNRSAGVAILLSHRRFKKHQVTQVMDPPPELAGRVAAIRLKQGSLDFTVIVAYSPPRPCSASAQRHWRA